MKIRDILQKDRPTISFEVFPPKTMDNYASVEKATMKIAELRDRPWDTHPVTAAQAAAPAPTPLISQPI